MLGEPSAPFAERPREKCLHGCCNDSLCRAARSRLTVDHGRGSSTYSCKMWLPGYLVRKLGFARSQARRRAIAIESLGCATVSSAAYRVKTSAGVIESVGCCLAPVESRKPK